MKDKKILGINFEVLLIIILIVLLASFGLINYNDMNFIVYYGGLFFFLGGLLVVTNSDENGIIFLISHGLSGLLMMICSILRIFAPEGSFFDNPALSDGYTGIITIYIIIVAILIIIAFIILIRASLKANITKRKNIISLGLFTIAVFMVAILPKIYIYLIRIIT